MQVVESIIFNKTLKDLVKGIRANKRDTATYISSCIAEIKAELKSNDIIVKLEAVIANLN